MLAFVMCSWMVFADKLYADATLGCNNILDCSLNGVCNGGACLCDAPWSGSSCATLRFKPATANQGYAMQPNVTSWGGGVIFDGKRYHLFACTITNGCPLSTWRQNSRIDHAVADEITGPYSFQDIAVNTWSHNPAPVRLPDATYAIFHIGDGSGTPYGGKRCTGDAIMDSEENQKVFVIEYVDNWAEHAWSRFLTFVDSHGMISDEWDMTALDKNGRAVEGPESIGRDQFPLKIIATKRAQVGSTIHVSSSLDGPWKPLLKNTLGYCNNPAPFVHPNGTIFIICGGSLMRADHVSGPWSVVSEIRFVGGLKGKYEDPFLYTDRHGFHVFYHVYDEADRVNCESAKTSAHVFSENGYDWYISSIEPFSPRIEFEHVTMLASTRERPHLAFDRHGQMTHLISAVCSAPQCANEAPCVNCKYTHWDFTLVQELDLTLPPHLLRQSAPLTNLASRTMLASSDEKVKSLASFHGSLLVTLVAMPPASQSCLFDHRSNADHMCAYESLQSLRSYRGSLIMV